MFWDGVGLVGKPLDQKTDPRPISALWHAPDLDPGTLANAIFLLVAVGRFSGRRLVASVTKVRWPGDVTWVAASGGNRLPGNGTLLFQSGANGI